MKKMDYLNFYSLLRQEESQKTKTLKHSKFYRTDKTIYNFLFIFDGKILIKNNSPFFYTSKYISKQFNKLSLSIISFIKNNIFMLCILNEEDINKFDFLIDSESFNVRDALFNLKIKNANILSAGYSLYRWQKNNTYCGNCGNKNKINDHGNSLMCSNKSCKRKIFPSAYPTIIVNIVHENKILLARNINWKKNLYSCIAGFCEQNESAEETVRREALEEVGLKLKNITYKYSQYWPFTNNLMLGFEATVYAQKNKIKINKNEIEKAKWFSSDDIKKLYKQKKLILPRKEAIAYSLITDWIRKN